MPTQRKIDSVAELTEKMSRMQSVIVADYRGITVEEITKVRNKIRPLGGEFIIAKNTLTLIAAKATGYAAIEPALYGPTALCFAYDDAAAVAKAIKEINAEIKKLSFRGAMLGDTYIGGDKALDIVASVPTRQEVLAQIVGTIDAPVSGIVGVLNSAATGVVYAVQGRIDKLGGDDKAA
ncbi:MAG: 50S ribosomal protein L10 [Roseiflexaceae bacterium]|jgi:large subunit ribosomal protein L10